jgi:hypothetical protein
MFGGLQYHETRVALLARAVAGFDGLAETEAAIARTEAEIEAWRACRAGRIHRKADQAAGIKRLEAAVRGGNGPVAGLPPWMGLMG